MCASVNQPCDNVGPNWTDDGYYRRLCRPHRPPYPPMSVESEWSHPSGSFFCFSMAWTPVWAIIRLEPLAHQVAQLLGWVCALMCCAGLGPVTVSRTWLQVFALCHLLPHLHCKDRPLYSTPVPRARTRTRDTASARNRPASC